MFPTRIRYFLVFVALIAFVSLFSSSPDEFRDHVDIHAFKYKKWFGEYYWRNDWFRPAVVDVTERQMAPTRLPIGANSAGYTLFDNLYLRSGKIYAVTDDPASFPEMDLVISPASENEKERSPLTSMHLVSPEDANKYLGEYAIALDGVSFIFCEADSYIWHYYRWWGELILGAMRVYSVLSTLPGTKVPLPEPRRILLPNVPEQQWRDSGNVNGPILRAGWPSTSVEGRDFWDDMNALNQTFVFERAMLISRTAAYRSPLRAQWFKMLASTMELPVSRTFWRSTQHRVVRNILGYIPFMNDDGVLVSPSRSLTEKPIVTYISRQLGAKKIKEESQEGLVDALRQLELEGVCELHVIVLENMTFAEQMDIIAKTTIMIGIHGTGLSHQIWMPSAPRSTIIEFFHPGAFPNDYELLARNVGHKHYGIWNDTYTTYRRTAPKEDGVVAYGARTPSTGEPISVHGPTVAKIVRERLTNQLHDL